MALFKRLRDLTMATVNDLLDKAEDPVKMVNQFIRDMEDDIGEAEVAVAKQIAIEKRFLEQRDEAAALVQKRAEQAERALELGNEELAKKALQDKIDQQTRYETYASEYTKAKTMADELRQRLGEMKDELLKMKSKREMLVARADAAKAQKQINHTMSSFGSGSAAAGFARMEEKVNQLEAEAEASSELRGSGKSLDDELKGLESESQLDQEMAALKAKMAAKKTDS